MRPSTEDDRDAERDQQDRPQDPERDVPDPEALEEEAHTCRDEEHARDQRGAVETRRQPWSMRTSPIPTVASSLIAGAPVGAGAESSAPNPASS